MSNASNGSPTEPKPDKKFSWAVFFGWVLIGYLVYSQWEIGKPIGPSFSTRPRTTTTPSTPSGPRTPYSPPTTLGPRTTEKYELGKDSFLPKRPKPFLGTVPPSPRKEPLQSTERKTRAEQNAAFWKDAVASLHADRFGSGPSEILNLKSIKNVFDEYQRKVKSARERTDAAKKAHQADARLARPTPTSSAQVDLDLITMVERQLDLDEETLSTMSEMFALLEKAGFLIDMSLTDEQIEAGLENLAKVQEDPTLLEKLDPETRAFVTRTLELMDALSQLEEQSYLELHEIEIMQARLQERYPGSDFSLPQFEE